MVKLAEVVHNYALHNYLRDRYLAPLHDHESAWGDGIPLLWSPEKKQATEIFFQSVWNKYREAILSDNLGRFEEEQHEMLRELILQTLNQPPNLPTNMIQFKSDGKTILEVGETTTERTVLLKAKINDPDGNKVKLQIELRRLDEYEGIFDEDAGGLKQSNLFENNSEIVIPIYGLADGDYHWRARAIDEYGLVSKWVSFGGNPDSAVDFTAGQEVLAPVITSPLKITPDSPYYVGDTVNAEFTITNKDSIPITFSVLTVGGRDPDNYVSDFTHKQNFILEPSQSYNYQGTLTLNKVGDYHFFCTYQAPDGEWNTNIDVGSKLTDEDRVNDIYAKENEKPSTSPDISEEVTDVSSSKNYFPLDEGKRWEYQIYVNKKEGFNFGLESKRYGKQVCTNLPQQELKGKRVTPVKIEETYGEFVYNNFSFYVKDHNYIYEFARLRPEYIEPKIINDYIIKFPIRVGNSWQETKTSSLDSRISFLIKSTIESIDEVVIVPAGTFKECLKIKSVGLAEKVFGEEQVWPPKENVKVERERYEWFAPDVGSIKMIFREKKTHSGGATVTFSDSIEIIMQLETFK
jgi:hypothetical protein